MQFASPYALMTSNVVEIQEEDMSTPLSQQQAQLRAVCAAPPPPTPFGSSTNGGFGRPAPPPPRGKPPPRFQRQIDTNIVTIPLGKLKDTVDLATGDACFCTNCNAATSAISILYNNQGQQVHPTTSTETASETKTETTPLPFTIPTNIQLETTQQLWICEFCSNPNVLELDPAEFPTKTILDYMLAPAPEVETKSQNDTTDTSLIFVCDVSGSMCVTQEIQGNIKLKGKTNDVDLSQFMETNHNGSLASQYLPNQAQNVTYVSRLQCMQAALSSQIEALARIYPNKRVGVVTFASDVVIYGDGQQDPVVVAGDRLQDFAHLLAAGQATHIDAKVDDSKDILEKKIWDFTESGATALGPAMVVAVSAAAQRPGSSVTLCTDGLANVGLGSLEDIDTNEAAEQKADAFYTRIGQYALDKGVVINVTGIEGCGCDVEHLGVMADITEGEVEKVAPMDLAKNFATCLQNPVVATKCQIAMFIHKGLQFRDDIEENMDDNKGKNEKPTDEKGTNEELKKKQTTCLIRDIGNVTEETDTSFEFNARSAIELKQLKCEDLKSLPFQVQVTYQKLDGSKYVRIITNVQQTTKDINVANQAADYSIMANHAEQMCNRIAKNGDYGSARGASRAYNHYMSSNESSMSQRQVSSAFMGSMVEMDDALESTMEAESLSMSFNSQSKKGMSMFRRKARSKNDKLSSMLSKGSKKSKSKKYMSASRSVLMPSPRDFSDANDDDDADDMAAFAKDYKESGIKGITEEDKMPERATLSGVQEEPLLDYEEEPLLDYEE